MSLNADRLQFAPPPTAGTLRALGLAIVAHAFLLAALTTGLSWKRELVVVSAEAELWSAVPREAAPRLDEAPPPPAPPPRPEPVVKVQDPPPAPKVPDADIVAEQDKRLKKAKEKELQDQKDRQSVKLKAEAQKRALLLKEKQEKEKLALDWKRLQEQQAELDKKKTDVDNKRKEAVRAKEELQLQEARRQENIKRMAGLAGASGNPGSTGSALQASGPSASYAGRIRARIKPNIVFTDDLTGNPMAEVEVRTSPDGTIISRKLTKPSGTQAWDNAVLKAIDKTEVLPRDVDGRVPPALVISFRPKD